MLSDYCLTTYTYHYAFHWQSYGITWTWYVAVMALGSILLRKETTLTRGVAATLLGPTGFFLASNYAVWVASSGMYPPTFAGLGAQATLPTLFLFYRNDLAATAIRSRCRARRACAVAADEPGSPARGACGKIAASVPGSPFVLIISGAIISVQEDTDGDGITTRAHVPRPVSEVFL